MKIQLTSILLVVFCQTKNPAITNTTSRTIQSVNETDFASELHYVDTAVFAVIPYDSSRMQYIFESVKGTNLSKKNLAQIDNLLNVNIAEYNVKKLAAYKEAGKKYPKMNFRKRDFLIDLTSYRRQYVAVINKKGETEVWINCFCSKEKYWRKALVQALDGGNCYFNVKLNLNQGKLYDMRVNGVA